MRKIGPTRRIRQLNELGKPLARARPLRVISEQAEYEGECIDGLAIAVHPPA